MAVANKLQVAVVTPEKAVARGDFDMVVAPSAMGQVGILPEHRPLLADLDVGVAELRRDGQAERYALSGGFLEVNDNRVVLLAETAERADEIDVERSKLALSDAEGKLKKLDPAGDEYAVEHARARRARNRLMVASA